MTVEEIKKEIKKLKKCIYEPQEQGDSPNNTVICVRRVFDKIDKWGEALENELERVNGANTIDFDKEVANGVSVSHLHDWYIHSVDNKEPVWTEKHIEELIGDFVLIPRSDMDKEYDNPKVGKNIVELPCAIGDIIWLKMTDGTMADGKVVDYTHFISCGFCLVVVSVEGTFNKMNIPFKDLIHSENDTIFLTKKA